MIKLLVELMILPFRILFWVIKELCWMILIGIGLFL